ncbi:MAG: glycosyl transferase [Maricaulis sp.]|jgi:glycosyltransferase involved in cell wall biosynthesis|nr:glycosyl transferase [Maricaulis sp.]HAQ34686.1 glycosyltransferase family 1 protein [Alphaproteobacteria bacterium]
MKDTIGDEPATTLAPAAGRALRVLLTGYRSHPHVGGQGVYLSELAKALQRAGHKVTVVSGPPYPDLPDTISLVRLPALNLFDVDNAFMAFRPVFLTRWPDFAEWACHNTAAFGELYAFACRLNDWLKGREDEFDVIHDNQTLATPFLSIAKRIPVIATIHHPIAIDREFAIDSATKRVDRWLTARWYDFVDMQEKTARVLPALLAVSEAARDSHVAWYGVDPMRVDVALNGIDHTVFRTDPSVTREAELIAATASADVPIKGLDVLMTAFVELAQSRPDLKLEMIGQLRDGRAKQILTEAGVMDRVTCRHGVSREDIAALYQRASVVACPARFEGFGFPAAEAMACGAPVVASDGGALPEVVGEAGRVVPAGDARALAAALGEVLDTPEAAHRMSVDGAERARQAFDWDRHAETAVSLYQRVMAAC